MRKIALISCIIVFSYTVLFAPIDPEVQDQLKNLQSSIAALNNSRPSFFKNTLSSIFSITLSGAALFAVIKLLDAYLPSRQRKLNAIEVEPQPEPQLVSFTFKDLAGKIPKDVLEITEFIKDTKKYTDMGAKMPRGILLVGPPGTGKTSIARAIAGECQAYFIAISASEFIEMFVGTGPRRVRDLFTKARHAVNSGAYRKAIIFIDELDSIGGARNAVFDAGGAEYRNTLNELLHQMDGFTVDDSIFVLAATNREQDIDPALKRAGRFDRVVEITLPDTESREAILKLYAKAIKHKGIDFKALALLAKGMTGAELKNAVNEAAIYAVRAQAKETSQKHFELALQSKAIRFLPS